MTVTRITFHVIKFRSDFSLNMVLNTCNKLRCRSNRVCIVAFATTEKKYGEAQLS